MTLLPWLESAARQLRDAHAAGRLPQALLMHEAPGTGAQSLARYFAQLRFCTEEPAPCGRCPHCRRVEQGEHPDLLLVGPDPESKLGQIGVDQVRELSGQLVMSSYEGRGTVAILQPAEALNRNAANALLKTLEEPRADAHLVLIAANPSLLPATIRSRCQGLSLPQPDRDAVLAWLNQNEPRHRNDWPAVLEVVGLAPLEAIASDVGQMLAIRAEVLSVLEEARHGRIDVIRTAEAWAKDHLELRLRCIENCLTARLLALRAGTRLQGGPPDINIGPALRLLDELHELQRQMATPLNKPLAVERHLWQLNRAGAG